MNKSLALSSVLNKMMMAAVLAAAGGAPWILRHYDNAKVIDLGLESVYVPMLIAFYLAVAAAVPALAALDRLLSNIKRGIIFYYGNVRILRLIPYCCFAEGAVFFFFGFYRPLSFTVSGAAFFFGLIMRVLKNVFEEAVVLKEENDYTI
jgi:hypothetical protein